MLLGAVLAPEVNAEAESEEIVLGFFCWLFVVKFPLFSLLGCILVLLGYSIVVFGFA